MENPFLVRLGGLGGGCNARPNATKIPFFVSGDWCCYTLRNAKAYEASRFLTQTQPASSPCKLSCSPASSVDATALRAWLLGPNNSSPDICQSASFRSYRNKVSMMQKSRRERGNNSPNLIGSFLGQGYDERKFLVVPSVLEGDGSSSQWTSGDAARLDPQHRQAADVWHGKLIGYQFGCVLFLGSTL